jgi:hypothetical protein
VPTPPELDPVTDPEFVMSSIGDLIELGNSPDPEGIRVRGLVPGQFEDGVKAPIRVIAEEYGVQEGTVKVWRWRARKYLRGDKP